MTRVLRLARQAAALLVLALTLLATQPASAVSYWGPSPWGTLGISQPTISQQFVLGLGESIRSARMLLDGVPVQPTWDANGLVSYLPPAPLAEGVHTVRLTVEIDSGIPGWEYDPIVHNFSFTVAKGAVTTLPAPGPEELRALQRVNAYRKAAGQSPMIYNASLGAAARGHANYLVTNKDRHEGSAHDEIPGLPGYIGTTAGDRTHFFGYGGGAGEVINFARRAEEAIDGWMETLYHRLSLIYPGNAEMGYGLAGDGAYFVNVLEAGPGTANGGAVIWPHNGQKDVPTGWNGLESPDPFRLYPGVTGPVGYTITLTFGGAVKSLSLEKWSLTGPSGAVAVLPFSPDNDDLLTDTVSLIPVAPLAPGVQYTVNMAGRVDVGQGVQPYTRTWSFTTAASSAPEMDSMVKTTRNGVLTRLTVTGSGFARGMKAFLGGLPVRGLEVTSAQSLTFEPPVGLGAGTHDLVVVTAAGQAAVWPEFIRVDAGSVPAAEKAFADLPVYVHGVALERPAKRHVDGTVLIPASALVALGALRIDVPEISRSYWMWGGRQGDYMMGHVLTEVGGEPYTLALPAQRIGGEEYVDSGWVSRLAPEQVRVTAGQVHLGLSDIGGHWAQPLIVRLVGDGIVSGVGAGQFRPEDPLTRAAFVKMLVGARKLNARPGDAGTFADTGSHWVAAQGYIGAAVQAGIVVPTEYPGRRFEPDLPISREDMAVMVTRALGLDAQARSYELSLSGGAATVVGRTFIDAATWSRPGYVAAAVEQGIINGYASADGSQYTFAPFRQATRAEAVAMIVRTIDK